MAHYFQQQVFETQVIRCQEILMKIPGISEDVAHLVYEYHENISGQGYPFKKQRSELHPLIKIPQAVNIFIELKLSVDGNSMSGINAILYLQKIYDDRLDGEVINAIESVPTK